jgi:hypothetical protein
MKETSKEVVDLTERTEDSRDFSQTMRASALKDNADAFVMKKRNRDQRNVTFVMNKEGSTIF